MHIELDIKKILLTAKRKENENIRFRSYLKSIGLKTGKVDSIVRKIYGDVIEQIDCTKCANCCNISKPSLNDKDIKIFVSGLGITEEDFRKNYLMKLDEQDEEGKNYEFNAVPCPFLKNNLCTNYENRPGDCRSYPHLQRDNFTSRLWGVIDNYEICPIVFNVYEELKIKLWRKREL